MAAVADTPNCVVYKVLLMKPRDGEPSRGFVVEEDKPKALKVDLQHQKPAAQIGVFKYQLTHRLDRQSYFLHGTCRQDCPLPAD